MSSDTENKALSILSGICKESRGLTRETILQYEDWARSMPNIHIPVKHFIHGGMYAREITIPKGVLITGDIYKFDHFDIMISGDVTVSTDEGVTKRLTGYNLFNGMSGKKRAGYAHSETTWITVHNFDGTTNDGEEIQGFLTAQSFEELEEFTSKVNQADYFIMLDDLGTDEDTVRLQSENLDDQIEMPEGFDNLMIYNSSIEGEGLYSDRKIKSGDLICPMRIGGKRTPAGRYTNHALHPNAKMVIVNGSVNMFAIKNIEAHEEITVNYRNVIKERLLKGDLCQE